MEELAKLEAERRNPEYLEGEPAEKGFRGQESHRRRQAGTSEDDIYFRA